MVKLLIDNKEVTVKENTSVLMAARSVGIDIPAMCFLNGHSNHPSCMVCIVKNKITGEFFPSCAISVTECMEIDTEDEEVLETRKDALELLLSDHVGDCEAPCRIGCPAFMNIPLMNRLISKGMYREALKVVKEEIALPLILGYICQAPCEKVCRRKPVDNPVSICQLKKFVAGADINSEEPFLPPFKTRSNKKVAIIGAGPAGLSSAFFLRKWGHQCVVFDRKGKLGGSLNKLSEEILPAEVFEKEIGMFDKYGIEWRLNSLVSADMITNRLIKEFDAIIIASGHSDTFDLSDSGIRCDNTGIIVNSDSMETSISGIFACGSAVKKQSMAIKALAQGKSAAWSVNRFLDGNPPEKKHRKFNSKFGKLFPEEYTEYLKEAVPDDQITPMEGVLSGFNVEEAAKEAARCMHCDCRKPISCKLRIYSDKYGADRRKYLTGDRKLIKKNFNHQTIVYEPEKCIKCGLCVDITRNEKELTGLSFVGKGFDVKIDVPFSKSLNEALTKTANKCAEACPTGAISLKNN